MSDSTSEKTIKINIPILTRVEGEGALDLVISGEEIEDLSLRIYEPPRFFEKFLEGRVVTEIPEMVARICGICPVAYQMSAVLALEELFGVETTPWVDDMRRLFYCGEWIQSHSLHIHLLAAPDFLGYDSAISMAADYPEEVKRGLRLQGLGNRIIAALGGRSVHPVGARIGGFHYAPSQEEMSSLLAEVKEGIEDSEALLRWLVTIELPEDEQEFISVALRDGSDHYPVMQGRIISDSGLDISISEFESRFSEFQVPHSTAFHAHLDGKPYLVGPLARINLNFDRIPSPVRKLCAELGINFPSNNMFHSLLARVVEMLIALYEAETVLSAYKVPDYPWVDFSPREGVAFGATCAPRGILWHRYDVDGAGKVVSSRIIPPTSQNQARIEEDLRSSLNSFGLSREEEEIKLHGEKVIRNYDPCISCATHFLKLQISRT